MYNRQTIQVRRCGNHDITFLVDDIRPEVSSKGGRS